MKHILSCESKASTVVEKEEDAWEIIPPWERRGAAKKKHPSKVEHDARYIESVIFVPHTPEGALKARLTRAETNLKYPSRTKVVEQMGRSLRETLCRAEPDPQHCGRGDCFPCGSAPGACMR